MSFSSFRKCAFFLCMTLFVLPLVAQNSYTLQKALQSAKLNNLSLKEEQLNLEAAQADIITARIRPNPVLSNQTILVAKPAAFPVNTGWDNSENLQMFWQLSRPFQIAGQHRYKIDVAAKNVLFAEKNYSETERNLFLDVADKWLDVWTSQKQLSIIQTALSNIDSLVTINRVRLKNQVITPTDLFRTELLAKQYSIQYRSVRQELVNKQKELAFLIGARDSVAIDTTYNFALPVAAVIDTLLGRSASNRSDILAAKSLIDASNSNIKLQKSLAFPQPELGFIYNPQNAVPYIGFSVSFELMISNRNQGEIKKSVILRQQAERQLLTIQSRLQTEVDIAFSSYKLQQENVKRFKSVLEQSQTILDNVRYAYLRGGTTIIDFLEAQRSWLETEQQYYDVLQQYHQSYVQLLFATGLINQIAQ